MTTDYTRLLDDEIRAFIQRTDDAYPPSSAGAGIEENRRNYDAMCEVFRTPHPAGLTVVDAPVAGVPTRRYTPQVAGAARVVYFHGGGFVLGGLESHDGVCAEIAAGTGLETVAVDYRLAPEHMHPAQFDDALAVARAEGAAAPVVLVGDSAGGNLAAAVAHALRGSGVTVKGQVLIYPGLGGPRGASHVTHAEAPMLTAWEVDTYGGVRFADGERPEEDPTAEPSVDPDMTGLPPTLAIAAECDPLADDATRYAGLLRAAGVEAEAVVEPGLVHGYLRARHMSEKAAASFARVIAAILDFAAR